LFVESDAIVSQVHWRKSAFCGVIMLLTRRKSKLRLEMVIEMAHFIHANTRKDPRRRTISFV
jgi:hypothetical protein